uniref:Kinase n=1 Tax=Neolamprologus brichardi TaxID=32507 RepID=A0A3Q4I1F7_NEOBR
MESSVALGRLELAHSSSAGGVTSRLPGGAPPKEKPGQPPSGLQSQAHLNGCVPLSHQVAGHKYGVDKVGKSLWQVLLHRDKPSYVFLSQVYAEDCCDPCLLELQTYLPRYYGTWSSPDRPNDLYLKLEDVTRHFIKPCIMDVKLGQRSYDPYASQEKREQQIRKYPLMEEIGFLVLGLRVYKVCTDTFDSYDQHYGRGLVTDTLKDGLSKFFHNGVSLRKDAVAASIRRVQRILRWFESQHQLTFYASSLLFVYEGLPSSSSSLSSLLSSPSVSPTEVAEYNNNNIQVAEHWDYSLDAVYSNRRKGEDGHRGDGGAVSAVSGDGVSAAGEEDNSAWKQSRELQRPPNGNGNKSQLQEKDVDREDGEEAKDRGGDETESGAGDVEVEVRMIDFAHVFPSESQDHGYVYGLKRLLTVLEQILCDAA